MNGEISRKMLFNVATISWSYANWKLRFAVYPLARLLVILKFNNLPNFNCEPG
jgi:hypothetical protein